MTPVESLSNPLYDYHMGALRDISSSLGFSHLSYIQTVHFFVFKNGLTFCTDDPDVTNLFENCVALSVKMAKAEPYNSGKVIALAKGFINSPERKGYFYPFSELGERGPGSEFVYALLSELSQKDSLTKFPFRPVREFAAAKRNYTLSILTTLQAFQLWIRVAAMQGISATCDKNNALCVEFLPEKQGAWVKARLSASMRKAVHFALRRQLLDLLRTERRMNEELRDIQGLLNAQNETFEAHLPTYDASQVSLHDAYPTFLDDIPFCLLETFTILERQLQFFVSHFETTKKIVVYLACEEQDKIDADLDGKSHFEITRFLEALPETYLDGYRALLPDILRLPGSSLQWLFMAKIETQTQKLLDALRALLEPAFVSMSVSEEIYRDLIPAETPEVLKKARAYSMPVLEDSVSIESDSAEALPGISFEALLELARLPEDSLNLAYAKHAFLNAEQLQFDLLQQLNFFISVGSTNEPLDLMVMITQCSRLLEQVLSAVASTKRRAKIQSHNHIQLYKESGLPFSPSVHRLVYGLNRLGIRSRCIPLLVYRRNNVMGEDLLRRAYKSLIERDKELNRDVIELVKDTLLVCQTLLNGKLLTAELFDRYIQVERPVCAAEEMEDSRLLEYVHRLDATAFFGASDVKANILLLAQRIEFEKVRVYPGLAHLRLVNFELLVYTLLEQIAAYHLEIFDVTEFDHDILKMLKRSRHDNMLNSVERAFLKKGKAVCLSARYLEMRKKTSSFQAAAQGAKSFGSRARPAALLGEADRRFYADYELGLTVAEKLLS